MSPSFWLRNIHPAYLSPCCFPFFTQKQQFDGKMFQILVPTQLSREMHKWGVGGGSKLTSLMSLHTKSSQSNSIISLIRLSVKMMLKHFFCCSISRAQTETPTQPGFAHSRHIMKALKQRSKTQIGWDCISSLCQMSMQKESISTGRVEVPGWRS